MKSYVIKNNKQEEYFAISDEIGLYSVSLENAQLFSLDEAIQCLEDNHILTDCSVYEVEITLGKKVE